MFTICKKNPLIPSLEMKDAVQASTGTLFTLYSQNPQQCNQFLLMGNICLCVNYSFPNGK